MKTHTKWRLVEFVVAGLLIDTIENVVSIKLSTGAVITKEVFIVAFLVVVPFSILTELIIDHPKFWEKVSKTLGRLLRR